jgi:hypothetical protein
MKTGDRLAACRTFSKEREDLMKRALFLCLIVFCLYSAAPAQMGQRLANNAASASPKTDARVRNALQELGLTYDLTPVSDFKLNPLPTEGERTQLVYVNSLTQRYGSLEIREIIAPALLHDGPLPDELALRLLRENSEVKLGAWRVAPVEGDKGHKYLVLYAIQIAADSDAETLRLAIKNVSLTADRLEKEITGRDDY